MWWLFWFMFSKMGTGILGLPFSLRSVSFLKNVFERSLIFSPRLHLKTVKTVILWNITVLQFKISFSYFNIQYLSLFCENDQQTVHCRDAPIALFAELGQNFYFRYLPIRSTDTCIFIAFVIKKNGYRNQKKMYNSWLSYLANRYFLQLFSH